MPHTIQVAAGDDGTLTYLIDHTPAELPPVRARDLLAAWHLAREAAHRAAWSSARAFRFRRADGGWTELALQDRDALCWAGAVDRAVGMETFYGLSVCLRLLALVDLLARATWTAGLVDLDPGGAELHPALLRAAAEARLTEEARLDEPGLRRRLQTLPTAGRAAVSGNPSQGVPTR
jgi:hypothetical protein